MRPWLARFSFSFFIVAAFLAMHVYRALTGRVAPVSPPRLATEELAAVVSFSLGLMGVRERHRPRGGDDAR